MRDMNYRILITTSDAYVHLTRGFAHQWNKYCGLPLTLIWRNIAPPPLPDNFTLLKSPARWHDWSGSLSGALENIYDEFILLGLEDFWLSDYADIKALDQAAAYLANNDDVMRIDLTEDRCAYPHYTRDGYLQAIIDPNAVQYLCSSQFSLWRRSFLQSALIPGELPPHFEVEGSRRVVSSSPVILGVGWRPLPYSGDGVVWNGILNPLHLEYLSEVDRAELAKEGLV